MTTLIGIKGQDFIIVGADTQVTEGNLRIPFPYPKIELVEESNLVAGCGSVGNLQRILQIAIRMIRVGKASEDSENISPKYSDLVKTLGELNFGLPLEYKAFSTYNFLVAGLDDGEPSIASVGSDGAVLNIPSFYSDGSGSSYAISTLEKGYSPEIKPKEALELGFEALKSATKLDCFTNSGFQIFLLKVDSKGRWSINEYNSVEQINELEEKHGSKNT